MQHVDTAREFAETMRQECLGARIARLHRVVARRFDQALRPLGLSMSQLEILGFLVRRAAPVRPSELAEVLFAERSTISRNLAALQDKGWVMVAELSPSGRSMAVTATSDGVRVLASARLAWANAQASVMDSLGPQAPMTIDTWLDDLV